MKVLTLLPRVSLKARSSTWTASEGTPRSMSRSIPVTCPAISTVVPAITLISVPTVKPVPADSAKPASSNWSTHRAGSRMDRLIRMPERLFNATAPRSWPLTLMIGATSVSTTGAVTR